MRRLLPIAVTLAMLPGCGGDGRGEAVEVARSWLQAVAEGEHERACELMAPSAVTGLRAKVRLGERANCVAAVRAYAQAVGGEDLDRVLEVGLEAEGTVKKDELGVFPQSGPRELEVILMRRRGDAWKVASIGLGFTRKG